MNHLQSMITQKLLFLKKINNQISRVDRYSKLFFLVLFISIILRITLISKIPLTFHIDEIYMLESAQKILDGQDLLKTYFSTTNISNFISAFSIYSFGPSAFSVRAQSIILGVLANIFLYLFTKNVFGKRTGLITFCIASFMHLSIAYSRINLPCIWGPLLLSASLYFFSKFEFIKYNKNHFFGFVTGLSFYTYTGAKIVGMVFILLVPILSIIGFEKKWISNYEKVFCSDLEKTIIDCLYKPQYASGVVEIVKAIDRSRKEININKMLDYLERFNADVVLKRLGFIMENFAEFDFIISSIENKISRSLSYLDPGYPKKGKYNNRWKIIDNVGIDEALNSLIT